MYGICIVHLNSLNDKRKPYMFFNYYLQNKNITNDTIHFSIKGLQEFSTQTNNVNFVICSKYILHSKKVKNFIFTLLFLYLCVCMDFNSFVNSCVYVCHYVFVKKQDQLFMFLFVSVCLCRVL